MNNEIKLSIIVPVYNVEKYVERCLKSLCGLKISNEIIVVNDGSIDNSLEIVEKFKEEYNNENIIIINQENCGQSVARNVGIKKAKGDYISFIDSDDFVDTEKFEELVNKTIESDLDIGQGNGIFYKNKKIKKFPRSKRLKSKSINTGIEWFKIFHKFKSYRPEIVLNIYKKEFLINNDLYFLEGRFHEDEEYMIRTLLNGKRVKYFDIDYYYYYLDNLNSTMHRTDKKRYYDLLDNASDILEYTKNADFKVKKIVYKKVRKYYRYINNNLRYSENDIQVINKKYFDLKKKYNLKGFEEDLLKKIEKYIRKIRDKLLKRKKNEL